MVFQHKRKGNVEENLHDKLVDAMEKASIAAAEEMRRVIETDRKTKASRERGGGRTVTYTKLDAVQSAEVDSSASDKSFRTSFGWSTADRRANSDRIAGGVHGESGSPVKSYFDLQDWGFKDRAEKPVAGMHAVEAGRAKFKEVMRQEWQH